MDDNEFRLPEGGWWELDIEPEEYEILKEVITDIQNGTYETDEERDEAIRAAISKIPDLRQRIIDKIQNTTHMSSDDLYAVGEEMLFTSLEEIISNPVGVSQEKIDSTVFAFLTWYPRLAKREVDESEYGLVDDIVGHYLSIIDTIKEFRAKMAVHEDNMTSLAPDVFRMMDKYNLS